MKTTTHELLKLMADHRFEKYAEYPTDDSDSTCIVWQGSLTRLRGRTVGVPIMRGQHAWINVRRYAWNLLYSHLDSKVRLRNTCGVERCINPDHHTRTDSFCKFGHALVGDNLHIQWATDNATGNRHSYERCRTCGREANYKYRAISPTYTRRAKSKTPTS